MGAINGTKTLQLIHDELTNNGLTRYTRQDIDNILKTLRRHPSTTNNGYSHTGIRYIYDEDTVIKTANQYACDKLAGRIIQTDGAGKALITGNLFRNPAHTRRWRDAVTQAMLPDAMYRERFSLILLTADQEFWSKIEPCLKHCDFDFAQADTLCQLDNETALLQFTAEIWGMTPTWYDPCLTVLLTSCNRDIAEIAAAVLLKTIQVIKRSETP